MYFLIENDDLLEKYNTNWGKVRFDFKKELDSKPVYYKKFLKTKIKSYGDVATDFHDKQKVSCNHTCLAVIFDSILRRMKAIITSVFTRMQIYWKRSD